MQYTAVGYHGIVFFVVPDPINYIVSVSEINHFILFASMQSVRGIALEETTSYDIDCIPPIIGHRRGRMGMNYVAVDYDAENETVYFSDVRNRVIYQAKIGESGAFGLFYLLFFGAF